MIDGRHDHSFFNNRYPNFELCPDYIASSTEAPFCRSIGGIISDFIISSMVLHVSAAIYEAGPTAPRPSPLIPPALEAPLPNVLPQTIFPPVHKHSPHK